MKFVLKIRPRFAGGSNIIFARVIERKERWTPAILRIIIRRGTSGSQCRTKSRCHAKWKQQNEACLLDNRSLPSIILARRKISAVYELTRCPYDLSDGASDVLVLDLIKEIPGAYQPRFLHETYGLEIRIGIHLRVAFIRQSVFRELILKRFR